MPPTPDSDAAAGLTSDAAGSGLAAYAARRLVSAVPATLLVILLSFVLMRAVPGGPFDSARALEPAVRANLEALYGLDQPLPVQFARYLASLARGDLGDSLSQKDRSVAELLAAGAPVSLMIGALALGVALAGGLAIGLAGALGAGGRLAGALGALTAAGLALPTFVLAPLLVLLFGLRLHWLPVAGWEAGRSADLVLPVLALAWLPLFELARLTRASTGEALGAPYVAAARARGLRQATVLLHYVLGPALRPVWSYLGPLAAAVLTGSLVVERLFGLPGMGAYLIDGALARDYPLVLGATLVYLVLLIALNLAAELAVGLLDPRLRRHWRAR